MATMSTGRSARLPAPRIGFAPTSPRPFHQPADDYDGGELVISDSFGTHRVKLPAGDMILYPGTSLHRVEPVTRGTRLASFFWIESMVRDDGRRQLLFDLDTAIQQLAADSAGQPGSRPAAQCLPQPAAALGRDMTRR